MKNFKFEPFPEKKRQGIIESNKRKYRHEQLHNIKNIAIFIMIFLIIPGLWIRHRVILAEKCSKLSYGHPIDVTREECGNLYFQTYEYWTPTAGKQRTIDPPNTWCIYNWQGTKYIAPCPTPLEHE